MAGAFNRRTGLDEDGDVVVSRPGRSFYARPQGRPGVKVGAPSVREAQVLSFLPFFNSPDIAAAAEKHGLTSDQKMGLGEVMQTFRSIGFEPKGAQYGSVFCLARTSKDGGADITVRVIPLPGPTGPLWSLVITSSDRSIHLNSLPLTLTGLKNEAIRQSTRLRIHETKQLDLDF